MEILIRSIVCICCIVGVYVLPPIAIMSIAILLLCKTNFKEIVGNINTLKHNGHKTPKTKIAIDFLYTDDGHVLCKRIAEKYKLTRLMVRGIAGKMAGDFKDKGLEQQIK